MKFLLLSLLLLPTFVSARYIQRDQEYYKVILSAKPFGDIAEQQSLDVNANVSQEKIEEEANKIQLCAMTILPDGRAAVGLIDNAPTPPSYLVLTEGESSSGLTLILLDYNRELATFVRDDLTFTLQLGKGIVETVTPEMLAKEEAEAIEKANQERKKHNSLAEQLISMQMSLPPDMEAPPLPIPLADTEAFTKKFDPNKEEVEPETDSEALVKAGVAELHEAIAAGESPQSYLQRLTEHRQKEVERQKAEKAAAQSALDQLLANPDLTDDDYKRAERSTNIELIKKGVVPLSPVENITPEEQAEIDAALNEPVKPE